MLAIKYKKVAVGGTFDQLHKGHIALIEKALEIGNHVDIGLTTDEMVKVNPKDHPVAKFDDRRLNLLKFLFVSNAIKRVNIVPISDSYGSAIDDKKLDALVVSHNTLYRGKEINEIRDKKGLRPLKLVIIDDVLAEDGLPISSTRIRRCIIDKDGHLIQFRKRALYKSKIQKNYVQAFRTIYSKTFSILIYFHYD